MKHWVTVLTWLTGTIYSVAGITATYTMTTEDDWTVLENAQAGDVVEIAPGTYNFRVHLDNTGTAGNPIVIRAADPANRPVWDLVGDASHLVGDAPGSYTAGDRGRGCWQVGPDGAHYEISGIVFRNCRDSASAGFRAVNSGPVKLTDCLFESNTNGLTGASEDYVVEHCEFRNNGQTFEGGNMTHNIYIYGGNFTMRYCYNHDSHEGQLFHIRAARAQIEYNWLARPASYVGDIMSCEYLCDGTSQHMTLLGNVIIQGTPENQSQIFALFDDEETGVTDMNISLFYNSVIGTPRNPGQTHNLLNLRNDTIDTHAVLANNIIYQIGAIAEVANPNLTNWSIYGGHNLISPGTDVTYVSNSIEASEPIFANVENLDFTLNENSEAVGAADPTLSDFPLREYYLNEETICAYRERQGMDDLGAFEYGTTGEGINAYGATPLPEVDTDADNTDTDDTESESIDTADWTDTTDTVDTANTTDSDTESGADTEDVTPVDSEATTDSEISTETGSIADTDTVADSSETTTVDTTQNADSDTTNSSMGADSDSGDGTVIDADNDSSDSEGCGCRTTGYAASRSLFQLLF